MSAGKLQALHKSWMKDNATDEKESLAESEEEEEEDEDDAGAEEKDEEDEEDAPLITSGIPSRSSSEAAQAHAEKDEEELELLPQTASDKPSGLSTLQAQNTELTRQFGWKTG